MATTTNYGWTTPDDTALVKDGAAAIRTLGSSVDTTTKNLNPSTTLGDIEYRSSTANTNTRLGIGTTGQVLTVSGGVPTWAAAAGGAGNMVQIATGTLSGTSVTISSLSTYTELLLIIYSCTNNTSDGKPYFRINNNSGATSYVHAGTVIEGTSGPSREVQTGTDLQFFVGGGNIDRTSTQQAYSARFFNCKNTGFTTYDITSSGKSVGAHNGTILKGVYQVSETVSSLVFANFGGTWSAGTYVLWGA